MSRSQRQSELGVRGEYVRFGSYFVNFGHFDPIFDPFRSFSVKIDCACATLNYQMIIHVYMFLFYLTFNGPTILLCIWI